jgi:Flp pilus assembly protein TadG
VNWRNDSGQAAGPEMMLVLVFALAAWGFLAWLGRLTSSSQDIHNTAQSAARAASIAGDPTSGRAAAQAAVNASNLPRPCAASPSVAMTWRGGDDGAWIGGSVTVTLSCQLGNAEPLSGSGRTVTASDTQVIDPYRQAAP